MFIVFNKEKINSYLISLGTVIVLFVMAFIIRNDYVQETSAKTENSVFLNTMQNSEVINAYYINIQNETNE